jgi:transposase
MGPELFEGLADQIMPEAAGHGLPRVRTPVRDQVAVHWLTLDELLPADHRARLVWLFVEKLDLSELYRAIKAVEGRPGHPPAAPPLLVALWLYATLEQVGSARMLDRRCGEHLGFRWMCGGVSMNYHTLAAFRVAHPEVLDRLLSQSFAACLHAGLADLDRVAQDGIRVRASAGAASFFRRRRTLEECHKLAKAEVARLRTEVRDDPAAGTRRQQAARQRAACERAARVGAALQAVEALAARQPRQEAESSQPPSETPPLSGAADKKPAEPRASTTDVEARVMKMGDGGFRPAFNVQFATATSSQLIAAVSIGNIGSDQGQLAPMVEQLGERYGQRPSEILVDGGFTKLADIEAVSATGETTVYAPVSKPRDPNRDPHAPRLGDPPGVIAWRARMATPDAQTIYKDRAATAECVNALARNRGLQRFLVRGLDKAKAVALWFALAHNLMRSLSLSTVTT